MNLYEIDHEILGCIDAETGEIFDAGRFEELQMERDAKIENVLLWMKNLKSDIAELETERKAFQEREKAAKNKFESLKKYITYALDGANFKTAKVSVSYRKSEAVEIEEGAVIPDEYLRFKEPEVDKTALKSALKSGVNIPGCCIVQNQNIQIR